MGARILIIEDNPTNMELMAYLLTAFGHTPLCAFDGEAGVEMARQHQPDLILCDVHLPKLDGCGVVAALKGDSAVAAIPVLAVTALAMVGDRERLLGAGFNGYVAKPIEPEQFVGQLEAFLVAPTPRLGEQKTLLIVDGDPVMRDRLHGIFALEGYAIVTAGNADDAIAHLASRAVHVVLCDQQVTAAADRPLCAHARQLAPSCYRIMLTAPDHNAAPRPAEPGGDIDHCVSKPCAGTPFDDAALRTAVARGFCTQAARTAAAPVAG